MMFNFVIFQIVAVAFCGLCIGALLSNAIPGDPVLLPRYLKWFFTSGQLKPTSSVPPWAYKLGTSLMALGVLGFMQYALVVRVLVDPVVTVESGPPFAIWFAVDEAVLLGWTAYVAWSFRRAVKRAK